MNLINSNKYKNGLVIGKFMPLHKGHMELIEFALSQSDHVTLAVCSTPSEPISVDLRIEWIKSVYSDNTAISIVKVDETLPRTKVHTPEVSLIWNRYFADTFSYVDAVFSSEQYGYDLAAFMGIEHVLYDAKREKTSVSATQIRENPLDYHHLIPKDVLDYFQKSLVPEMA